MDFKESGMDSVKGIILAGGRGTRLLPFTKVINKHLLPVGNRPMIYFPIRTLREMGYKDIVIVTGGENIGSFVEMLGDGSDYGVNLTYRVQLKPGGIAHALGCAEGLTEGLFPVILGDNYFEKPVPSDCPAIIVKQVENPQRFGVYHNRSIVEKPKQYIEGPAVVGLYWYDNRVFDVIKNLKPSPRGELEITDVNNWYLEQPETKVMNYDGYWSDMGTIDSLHEVIRRSFG